MTVRLTIDDPPSLLAWAAGRAGMTSPPKGCKAIGVLVDDQLSAVLAYSNFSSLNCVFYIYTDKKRCWATRPVLRMMFHYPFVQCGLGRITAFIDADNRQSMIMCLKLGFRLEGVLRGPSDTSEDVYVLGMLRSECRWLDDERRS